MKSHSVFDHLLTPQRCLIQPRLGNRFAVDFPPVLLWMKRQLLHGHEIDDAAERIGLMSRPQPDRNLNRHRIGMQPIANLLKRPFEVGAFTIQFVDEHNPRHVVFVGLPPDRFALRLDPFPSR